MNSLVLRMSHLISRVVSCRGEQDATEYNTAGRGAICGREKRPDYCTLATEVDTEVDAKASAPRSRIRPIGKVA